ncbi:MAG: RecQ family ATP-dependent DNA helicase [Thermoguttaceae bacterium]|nr:RecQ family ATP-dependent DNA helicase [Thermoguttaceae bacterium]
MSADALTDRIYRTLADAFGYRTFRPYQEEIVRALLDRRDVFAVMPTGGGKSLCYQLPALLTPGVCVVVSPLLSLMKDQVDAAQKNGICAATLNSTTSLAELRDIYASADRRTLDLLYVSPERFNTPRFQEFLKSVELGFFAVDEAHCISQWGHNFRADYLELGQIADLFPNCPIAAFTATATDRVSEDVQTLLKLRDPFCVRASFDRPNLFYQIAYKEDFDRQLLDFLREIPDESGVVYRSTRKNVEKTAEFLRKQGFKAEAYHAGLTDAERARVQDAFANDETPIVVATIAFGMGIDKSNVRFVVHGDLPKDVESYYQETGRAGRDGAPARCLLVYGYQDVAIHRSFLDDYQDPEAREAASRRLNEMVAFAETDGCRRANLLKYFGETYIPPNFNADENGSDSADDAASSESASKTGCGCGGCDYCVGSVRRVDATVDAQKALSAMQRTGNAFGVGHIVDVLIGARTEKVERFGHDRLPTFGVGADRNKTYWRYLISALLTQGIAELDPSKNFPIPRVTRLGWDVMRGQRQVKIVERPTGKKKKTTSRRSGGSSTFLTGSGASVPFASASANPYSKSSLSPRDRRLFEELRALRLQIAKDENVPPYAVFSDKTLVDMTCLKPETDGEFLDVSGVGRKKLENYGYEFMQAIRKFLEENPK